MVNNMMLQIVKGLPGVPGDTLTVEHIDEVIDLLGSRNWSVDNRGWVPQMPQVKDGGVYVDNPVIAGKFPIVMTLGDVQETITLVNRGASVASRSWIEQKLFRLARDAEDFWTTDTQTQPVYLVFQPSNGVGPQYARIYTMDIAPQMDVMERQNYGKVTITIDREHGWTPIPPGANPKWASYIINGTESTWLAQSGASLASLYSGTDHLTYGTCSGIQEFNTLYTFLTVNYIDIPASKIPGDLPAAVCIDVEIQDGVGTQTLYIAKSTKPTSITDRAGNALPLYNILVAPGAAIQDGGSFATVTYGVVHTPASALRRVYNPNFATTSEALRLFWTVGGTNYPHLNPNILRGTYAVFIRGMQRNGAAGLTNVRLTLTSTGDFVFFDSGKVNIQLKTDGDIALHYMGIVTLPYDKPSMISARGTGTQVEYDFLAYLYAQRTSATGAAVLDIMDIVFMPIDEGMVQVETDYYDNGASQPFQHVYDNTGYFTHGKPEGVFTIHGVPGASNNEYTPKSEFKGSQIMLSPGVNNRLYFLSISGAFTPPTSGAWKYDVFINAVPRWSGIRDI